MAEDIKIRGLKLDIKVMERKEKHGTITPGERIMLKSWRRYALNSVARHSVKQQHGKLPSGNSSVLNNARFPSGKSNYVTSGRPVKKGDDISRQTKWRRNQKGNQAVLF